MSYIQMRTVPGLFIGRRTVICAEVLNEGDEAAYICGACEQPLLAAADPAALRDVVVRCGCGEINQL